MLTCCMLGMSELGNYSIHTDRVSCCTPSLGFFFVLVLKSLYGNVSVT